jgi:hypothetical protein
VGNTSKPPNRPWVPPVELMLTSEVSEPAGDRMAPLHPPWLSIATTAAPLTVVVSAVQVTEALLPCG